MFNVKRILRAGKWAQNQSLYEILNILKTYKYTLPQDFFCSCLRIDLKQLLTNPDIYTNRKKKTIQRTYNIAWDTKTYS